MNTKKRKPTRRVGDPKSEAVAFLEEISGGSLTFGGLLLSIRLGEEWTQAEMGTQLGVSRANICDIEKGRRFVSPERAARFARVLGYSPEQFVQLTLQDQVREAGLKMDVKILVA